MYFPSAISFDGFLEKNFRSTFDVRAAVLIFRFRLNICIYIRCVYVSICTCIDSMIDGNLISARNVSCKVYVSRGMPFLSGHV